MSSWRNSDISMHSRHAGMPRMTSTWCKCDIIMHSQQPVSWHISTGDPPAMSSAASWAKLSRAIVSRAEPRAEGEDSVQRSLRATGSEIESGSFIRPELFWSNLSRLKCNLDDFRLVFQLIWLFRMQWCGPIVEIETRNDGGEVTKEIAQLGGI
jgi:hypothetical protein